MSVGVTIDFWSVIGRRVLIRVGFIGWCLECGFLDVFWVWDGMRFVWVETVVAGSLGWGWVDILWWRVEVGNGVLCFRWFGFLVVAVGGGEWWCGGWTGLIGWIFGE